MQSSEAPRQSAVRGLPSGNARSATGKFVKLERIPRRVCGQKCSDQTPSQVVRDAVDATRLNAASSNAPVLRAKASRASGSWAKAPSGSCRGLPADRRGGAIPIDQAHLARIGDQDIRHVAVAWIGTGVMSRLQKPRLQIAIPRPAIRHRTGSWAFDDITAA